MPFIDTSFPGLFIFEPRVFEDSRGYFFESFNDRIFRERESPPNGYRITNPVLLMG